MFKKLFHILSSFLTNLFKSKYLIAVIAILVIFITIQRLMISGLNSGISNKNRELFSKTENIRILEDKAGSLYFQSEQYSSTIRNLKRTSDSLEAEVYRQAKLNGIKDSRIKELETHLLSSTGVIYTVIDTIYLDGLPSSFNAHFDNGSLVADVSFNSSGASIEYSYSTRMFIIKHKKKEPNKFFLFRWLGVLPRSTYVAVDYKASDTNARISEVREIIVE